MNKCALRHSCLIRCRLEDQGFYECIIRKPESERTQQILLLVEQTSDNPITNLKITVDHTRSCFTSHFDVPKDVDFRIAQMSTYFLIYYTADMKTPLNTIPGTSEVKCDPDNHCAIR